MDRNVQGSFLASTTKTAMRETTDVSLKGSVYITQEKGSSLKDGQDMNGNTASKTHGLEEKELTDSLFPRAPSHMFLHNSFMITSMQTGGPTVP